MNYLAAIVCFVTALACGALYMALPDGVWLPLLDVSLLAGFGLSSSAGVWLAGRT